MMNSFLRQLGEVVWEENGEDTLVWKSSPSEQHSKYSVKEAYGFFISNMCTMPFSLFTDITTNNPF